MSVSKLINGDWSFGQSKANYIQGRAEILQNVVTRIKSFQNDWFLDTSAHIDWFNLMGSRNATESMRQQITQTVLGTTGVLTLDVLNIVVDNESRRVSIEITYTDIYQEQNQVSTEI